MRARLAGLGAAALVLVAACGSGSPDAAPGGQPASPTPQSPHTEHSETTAPVKQKPLRAGERRIDVRMPAAYTPSAPTGVGTDDYRCFLLDPKITTDSFVTGFDVKPGNPDVVHHVILFRVPPDQVAAAEKRDDETPGQGWTCFGTSGMGSGGGSIDDAPWIGAWAPGGAEQLYGDGLGEELDAGSRIVMQVHYNLAAGVAPDTSAAMLRITEDPATTVLETKLLPAQVELPCRPGKATDKLCDRAEAMKDLIARFGPSGRTADFLHLLCGSTPPGPVQSCTREIEGTETIRGVAGHMHLLGRSIRIETNPGTPRAKVVLDIPVWDFDNQRSRPISPVTLKKGDTIRVTCTHSQDLRDHVPAFQGQPDRYVAWGEGTTDEMCLGILLVTRP